MSATALVRINRPEEKEPLQERQLLDFLERLAKFRGDRYAVHIHLSKLFAYNRRGRQVRIAAHLFEPLVSHINGQLFSMNNGDLIYIWKSAKIDAIDDAVMCLRHLFSEDPLTEEIDEQQQGGFCTWYDLELQYDAFLAVARELHVSEQQRARRLAAIVEASSKGRPNDLQPLNANCLRQLVDLIAQADLSSMMRRQAICAVTRDAPPKTMFHELYISIDELRNTVMPEYDLASDRWLFQHLTKALDSRMLQLMMKNDDSALAKAFSINLNVATLLSDRFLEFDTSLRAATRCTVIFELQLLDVLSDLRAYLFARDFAKARGYRICLDGITDLTLPTIDFERIGADLVKIIWNPETLNNGDTSRHKEVRKVVSSLGRARTILCRCDSAEAVTVGQSLGINLFQGRHVDRMIRGGDIDRAALRKLQPVSWAMAYAKQWESLDNSAHAETFQSTLGRT